MKFEIKKIPLKINPCPIAEAIVELRFESNLTSEVILATIFNELKEKFPKIEPLPIMQVPIFIRDSDINFKYAPHYRLANNDYIIQIGPRCFSITCPNEYKGWENFSEQIKWSFEKFIKLKFVEKPIRLGVRFINFFKDCNIFENIKISFKLADNSFLTNQNVLRSEFEYSDFNCVLQLTNAASLINSNAKGSSIDLDVICNDNFDGMNGFIKIIENAHAVEKEIFFSILKNEFLIKFNPEY